jgi:hypothetical protein
LDFGRNVPANAAWALDDKIGGRVDEWLREHPELHEQYPATWGDLFKPMIQGIFGGIDSFPTGEAAFAFAYGASDAIDVEAGVTTLGYMRAGAKVQLARFDRGALSLSPAIGFVSLRETFKDSYHELDYKDELAGWAGTIEAPLLIGWRLGSSSPYVGVHFSYLRAEATLTREIKQTDPDFRGSVFQAYDVAAVGLGGAQFRLEQFVLTPELVATYSFQNPPDAWPALFVTPGFAVGLQVP